MRAQLLLACTLAAWALPAQSASISQVRHSPQSFDPAQGESAQISFRLSADAPTTLQIYDGRELRIRQIDLGPVVTGEREASWDGRDDLGRLVPPEAYTYALITGDESNRTVWDLAGTTGGEPVPVHDVRWNTETGNIDYRLEKAARVRIRIGLKNEGPLLRTLIDWVPRGEGRHAEAWDGKDSAGVFDLATHAKLSVRAEAFALPSNTLLVTPAPDQVDLIKGLPANTPRRERTTRPKYRMFDFARQPIETRRDFEIFLAPVGDVKHASDGTPVVDGALALQLGVGDDDLAAILAERCEAVFFVDGQFVFEREVGFLPMTWTWTPTSTSPGTHHITANLRGYEGHFGMTTLRVVVEAGEPE